MPNHAATPSQRPTIDNESSMPARDLTLIVAATNKMGIGLRGRLPWTGLKKEMAYFARVTKRAKPGATNAVIMGRKTWNSIPVPYRPLKDRKNVVISRQSFREAESEGSIHASSIEDAVGLAEISSERIFVIGGAQIYEEALRKEQARRILLTRILTDFECDTFLPITLGEDGKADGWERKSKEELDAWVGETVAEGVQEEHGAKYVFEMWERIERNAN